MVAAPAGVAGTQQRATLVTTIVCHDNNLDVEFFMVSRWFGYCTARLLGAAGAGLAEPPSCGMGWVEAMMSSYQVYAVGCA